MGATIADVAERAGVSKATVSRVINNHSVRASTKAKVLQAMRYLDYQPNAHARGLTSGKSSVIGVIVPGIRNQFYGAIIEGVNMLLEGFGYHMILASTGHTYGREWSVAKMMKERRADGVLIVTPRALTPEDFLSLSSSRFPIVLADGYSECLSCVVVDNFEGARKAVEHLVSLGHKDIAMITGPSTAYESRQRIDGYRTALMQHDLMARPDFLIPGDYTVECGLRAADQLLKLQQVPTAVFAANDSMAIGLINGLARHGVSVPGDIAVVGYDDIESASLVRPSLTTIRQPLSELGKVAARKLLSVVQGTETETVRMLLSAELVVRESSGAPMAQSPEHVPNVQPDPALDSGRKPQQRTS